MKKKSIFKLIFNIFVLSLSVGLLVYFCISKDGLVDLLKNIKGFNKNWLIIGLTFQLTNLFIDIILIYLFTKQSVSGYSLKKALKTSMVGQFFSAVTPGASGGQPMQLYSMTKQNVDPGIASSVLIQKFLTYQTTLTLYSLISILICFNIFKGSLSMFMWLFAIIGFLGQSVVIGLLLMFSFNTFVTKRFIYKLFKFLNKIHLIKNYEKKLTEVETQLEYFHKTNKHLYKDKKLCIEAYILTAVQLICMFIVPYCIYRTFYFHGAKIVDMLASEAFVTMASSLIPIPGASGASEGSFYVFFGLYFTQSTIKPAILLWRFITYYLTIALSAPFSVFVKKKHICHCKKGEIN